MKADLGIMQNAARVASNRSSYVRAIDLVGMIEQFSSSVLAELDYNGEAYNAYRLRASMANIEGVTVPFIYHDLSTSKILTMDYVEGVKISNIKAIENAGLDKALLADHALRSVIKQLLIDGFFHADPHPGNVLVNLETGEITFIDTGMVGELDLTQRLNLIQLIYALQQQDVSALAQIMRSLSTPFVDEVDEAGYYKAFEHTIGRMMYTGNVSVSEAVNTAFDLLREYGLRLDPNLTMAIKAIMQAEAISSLLYPEGGIINQGVGMIREMAIEEVNADKIKDVVTKQLSMSAREVFRRLPSFQEATVKWLDQYQKGRFEVYVDTSDLAKEVDKVKGLGHQLIIAIMLVGMIVGSAIATSVLATSGLTGRFWDFIFRLAYFGYVFAMLATVIIVVLLIWRWLKGKD